ncbi:MAG: S-methyl-5'-thioadenosine phosphorylase [Candidatus Dactylopiibacterium carminicum]|uniref:Probable S-methyl-5'-thioinosine phosphorylase n=1 Tax=Candidatus Dactylopiibacterium carminicum TaxID=857335 RepID=A0A272EQB5_9RHOO|nr:S-methyl-5'-thioinosine phosphorylase [Candidatus Dactylopiibacterium carminicum]KAF7598563.1 S-methyl-5'-thioadenosine phosphorylase [Candidatus Dactylopiibacterium carminicum]PAS92303.1 MAG: S-methyl-5'-thioadenosine phosphorylase [Candidatus Dactylopiibacterium carminicum]PAS98224.1 MAG: methylthioadenosine phosphorylase [Candidatus Dactylopiibacterium carminicum]
MIAIIGGSGLSKLSTLDIDRREVVRTPYGEPSGALQFGHICDQQTVFIARHGYGHTIPPHAVNYRANIWALKHAGAEAIISVASVGGIAERFKPGSLLVPDQIIDYTWGRKSTFFDGPDQEVVQVDFTDPYDSGLRQRILTASAKAGETIFDGGTYAATQGPRLETAAEITRLERDGADVVGMTGMPEAVLARELELPYAAILVVANHAAGRGNSEHRISMDQVDITLQKAMARVRNLLQHFCSSCT